MSKLNGLGKTHIEHIFVVKLKLKLHSLFHYKQIIWENSDIKLMKVPSQPNTSHFNFLGTIFEWLKLIADGF